MLRTFRLPISRMMLLVVTVLFLTSQPVSAQCGWYSNSGVIFSNYKGFSANCGGTGYSCSECTALGSSGYTVCTADPTFSICLDYNY